jgi:holliday junction DNA helicase RuvA
MISFVRGRLAEVYDNRCIVETAGLGMEVNVPLTVLEALPHIGEEVILYTYFKIAEDSMSLYGFLSRRDEEMFERLISVSGIGPKAALAILSTLAPDDLRVAIAAGDAKAIARAPGVGAKTAQRLILELKDKIDLSEIIGGSSSYGGAAAAGESAETSASKEAAEALIALGYSASEAMKAVRASAQEGMDSEAVLKAALKYLI